MLLGDGPRRGVNGDEGEAHLQDPAVHDVTHGEGQLDFFLTVYSLGQSQRVQLSAHRPLSPRHPGQPGSRRLLPVVSFPGGGALGWGQELGPSLAVSPRLPSAGGARTSWFVPY